MGEGKLHDGSESSQKFVKLDNPHLATSGLLSNSILTFQTLVVKRL